MFNLRRKKLFIEFLAHSKFVGCQFAVKFEKIYITQTNTILRSPVKTN